MPRIVIAAPASGHGKTTVATGIIKALTDRGFTVAPFKVGPDYIDPGYHCLAAGRTGRNLDPYMVGTERIAPLFAHGAAGADLAVVEGVMGLYDGATGEGELASTAQVAKLLGAPVLFVVDAAAQGRSIAALLHGFRSFDPAVRIAGVVLNRVGSENHRTILTQALEEIGLPVLGALRRDAAVWAPSRHLGLVPVAERRAEALASVAALGALADTGLQLDEVYRLARSAPPLDVTAWDPFEEVGSRRGARPRVAVASGPAFTFSYAENTELLAAAGAEICPFDPLREEKLPERVCGLVLGGGFPEVYAPELAANEALRENVSEFARLGGAIAAECAGLLYLGKSLDGAADVRGRGRRSGDDRPAHPRLPARRGRLRVGARRRRDARVRARIPPHRRQPVGRLAAGLALAPRRGSGHRRLCQEPDPRLLPASALGRGALDRPAAGRELRGGVMRQCADRCRRRSG